MPAFSHSSVTQTYKTVLIQINHTIKLLLGCFISHTPTESRLFLNRAKVLLNCIQQSIALIDSQLPLLQYETLFGVGLFVYIMPSSARFVYGNTMNRLELHVTTIKSIVIELNALLYGLEQLQQDVYHQQVVVYMTKYIELLDNAQTIFINNINQQVFDQQRHLQTSINDVIYALNQTIHSYRYARQELLYHGQDVYHERERFERNNNNHNTNNNHHHDQLHQIQLKSYQQTRNISQLNFTVLHIFSTCEKLLLLNNEPDYLPTSYIKRWLLFWQQYIKTTFLSYISYQYWFSVLYNIDWFRLREAIKFGIALELASIFQFLPDKVQIGTVCRLLFRLN